MKNVIIICVLATLIGVPAWAGSPSSFEVVMDHYEPIRLALLGDSMKGVNNHGRSIATELRALRGNFSESHAGASGDVPPVIKEKLAEMITAADGMANATSLEAARDAFYDLTKPLVRWREGAPKENRPSVGYCSMYKRSWLQPGGEIGNPYGGMPRCGRIVTR